MTGFATSPISFLLLLLTWHSFADMGVKQFHAAHVSFMMFNIKDSRVFISLTITEWIVLRLYSPAVIKKEGTLQNDKYFH